MRLEAFAAIMVLLLLGIRFLMSLPAELGLFWGYFLYFLVVTAGVYWLYPAAIPIPIDSDFEGRHRLSMLLSRGLRYFTACLSAVLVVVTGTVILFAS